MSDAADDDYANDFGRIEPETDAEADSPETVLVEEVTE